MLIVLLQQALSSLTTNSTVFAHVTGNMLTLPAPPPCSTGSCVVTQSVWQIWVLPVLEQETSAQGDDTNATCTSCSLNAVLPELAIDLRDAP